MREWENTFLDELAKSPNVTGAAAKAGISRVAVYAYRNEDEGFRQRWDDALESATDGLVGALHGRAKDGVDEGVYYRGEKVATEKRYSDTLGMFLLKSHRPAVYRDSIDQHISGPNGAPLEIRVVYDDVEPTSLRSAPPPQLVDMADIIDVDPE